MFEEIGGEHRGDEACGEQREEYLHRHRDAELLEELPGHAGHEACGCEDRNDRQRDRDHGKPDFVGGFQRVDPLLHRGGHDHVARALRALDAERHHRFAVEAGEGSAVGDGVGDGAEVVEPNLAAAEQRDHRAFEFAERLGASQRADRLIVLADLGAAAGEIDIGAAQALADVDRGEPRRLQPVGVERHHNFALDAADALDLGDAAHALQRAFDDVVDEIRQLLRRLAGRNRRVSNDRQADHVDPLNERLGDVLRQVGAYSSDRVLDVVERAVGVGFEHELDRRHRQPVGDRRGNMPHALDARDAVFDRLGDLRFKLGRCRAELRHRDRDHRDVGRRQPRHREFGEADPAEREQDDRKHDRGERMSDRPCRDIQSHQGVLVRSRSSANTVLIRSPSCSEVPASATTISPTARPSRISVAVSDTRPTRTRRVSTMLPLTTCTVRWSIAVRGIDTPQLRLASMLARAKMPILSEGLPASVILTWPSCVARSICGDTSRTRPITSGVLSRLMRTVAPGLSLSIWTLGTSASISMSLLMEMRNIGPACGDAGAPAMVLTWVTRPAAGARNEVDAGLAPEGPGGGVSRASSWFSVTISPSCTRRSETLEPSWSAPTTASRRGTIKPVTRTMSEKQASVDLVTMTSALPAASFASGRERCSTQYHPAPKAATAIIANTGLRNLKRVIVRSVQSWVVRCLSRMVSTNPVTCEFLHDIRVHGFGVGDVQVALGRRAVALFGEAAPVQRGGQSRIDLERGVKIDDRIFHLSVLQIDEA